MPEEKLVIVYKLDTFDVETALEGIRRTLTAHGVPLDGFALYEDPLGFDDILHELKSAKRKTFNLIGQGFEFDLGCVRNFLLDFLEIRDKNQHDISWDQWAAQFVANSNFVMAWAANVEYDFWQNAQDPLQYTARGKSFEQLPKRSNGLPYPLERTIIDTSHNPGRKLLRGGYYEVVGALMWLGEPFWQLTGASKMETRRAASLQVVDLSPEVLKIEAAPRLFTTDQGSSGELQQRLRSRLFPEK